VAHKARVTEAEAKQAIEILESPDENSAPDEHEGRRVERVPGGWMVLNSEKYRNLVTRAMIREQTRIRVARKRAKDKGVTQCNEPVTHSNARVTPSRAIAKAEKEGANGSRPTVNFKSFSDVDAWIDILQHEAAYKQINVRTEYSKMLNWCKVNKKQPTQRRFVNWLNRTEHPLAASRSTQQVYGKNRLPPANEISDEELERQRKIVRDASAKLRDELKK
jgi:hypothetical protein